MFACLSAFFSCCLFSHVVVAVVKDFLALSLFAFYFPKQNVEIFCFCTFSYSIILPFTVSSPLEYINVYLLSVFPLITTVVV